MFKKIEDIIKKLEGNVLVISINDELINTFNKNNKVNLYSINSNKGNGIFSKSKKRTTNKGKTINIKKLRKYINKKSVDYIICNMEDVMGYYKYLIKDTIYLNNNTIYIYSSNKVDKDFLIKKYKRYNVEVDVTDYKNGFIITINNKNGKTNFFKDKLYFIKDTLYNFAEFIGNILVS